MPERATISELTQIGIEAPEAPGTAVAATRRLKATGFTLDPEVDFDTFRPEGSKFATMVDPTKEWSTGDLEGRLTYDEFAYLLSMNVGTGTRVAEGTGHKWTFQSNTGAPDSPLTATLERGSSVRAARAPGIVIPDLELTIDRDAGCTIGGGILGAAIQDGIALTAAGVTETEPVPVRVGEVSVFLDATFAALGATKLTRLRRVKFTFGDRFSPVWVLDRAKSSYVATVETEPTCELELTMEADAQGDGVLLPVMRAGATRHVRVEAIGPVIGAGPTTHKFTLDVAGKVSDMGGNDDDDGLVVRTWTLSAVADSVAGRAFRFELVNTLAAL